MAKYISIMYIFIYHVCISQEGTLDPETLTVFCQASLPKERDYKCSRMKVVCNLGTIKDWSCACDIRGGIAIVDMTMRCVDKETANIMTMLPQAQTRTQLLW